MMRARISVWVVVFGTLLVTDVLAQGNQYGVRVGINRVSVDGVRGDYAVERGFVSGFLQIDVPRFTNVRFEVGFARRGYGLEVENFRDVDGNVLIENFEAVYQLNYLEIPALLSMKLPVGGPLRVDALVGPYVGILLHEEQEILQIGSLEPSEIVGLNYNSLDAGLQFGFMFGYRFSKNSIGIDFRYTLGVVNIFPDGISSTRSLVNRGGGFGLSYGRLF